MSQVLDEADIADPSIPVYANVTAQPVQDGKQVRELLKRQIRSPVRWEDAVRAAGEEKPDVMVELGPGQVLSGLNKRILEGIPVHNVEDTQSLEQAVSALGELN
jgi:[acyl-carrier-protein] S-malonyltransferase